MAVPIQFDTANVPLLPHLILATKSGKLIRELPIDDVQFHESLTGGSEFSFNVYRERCVLPDGGIDDGFWKGITDLRLVYCRDYDRWYELKVDRSESTDVLKSVTATSLAEAELSQINVYGIEVNTEADIEREDYQPTVLYNANKKISLIDRLLYKAPHYSVKHVDDSIKDIQRTFSFDGKTIYDSFNEVSTEIGCLFLYDCVMDENGGIDREISVYDLEYHCPVCGLRGEYMTVCENCGNNTVPGYGTDTKIFVARENLASEINYTTNTDAVKNCFRLEAGDDLMTAGVISCNPNGSQYIWYITDAMRADMSQALQNRLAAYDSLYDYYQSEATYSPPSEIRAAYNTLIQKYQAYRSDLMEMPETITGYPAMMKSYFDTIDFQIFLESELMPSVEISTTSAAEEAAKLTSYSLDTVAVAKLSSCTKETADSAVIAMAKCIVRSTFQVKVNTSSYNATNHIWTGTIKVTNYGDEEDTAVSNSITTTVTEDLEQYIQQKIDRMINQTADDPTDISALFKLDIDQFTAELPKYCRNRLGAFRDACQAALDILIQQGVADQKSWVSEENNLYTNMYLPYKAKMTAIENELAVRNEELAIVNGTYDESGGLLTDGMESLIKAHIDEIRSTLNFESYIGEGLWEEFASYRRESVYKNDNYVSDGLDNFQLMTNAQIFLNNARKEIFKSATMQHSISATLNNLLVMKEFQPIVKLFRVGNWIRIKSDGEVYRLRLSEYTVDYRSWDLDVVFTDLKQGYSAASDLQSMLSSLRSMQTTYGTVARQAASGEQGKEVMDRWVEEGLALTTQIVGGARNQEFYWDETGFTGKEWIEETGTYSPEQVKIISQGIYMTDNNWVTAKAALGKFKFWNPQTGVEEEAFGVIADKLVGSVVLSEEVGVYNQSGSVQLDENGFTLITNASNNTSVFNIKKKTGPNTYLNILSLDTNGNLVLGGDGILGSISASRIYGGTLTLGGYQNGNGSFVIKDNSNNTIISGDNTGLFVYKGTIQGPSIIAGGLNNSNGTLTVKNASNADILSVSNAGMTLYCRSSSNSFLIKDGNGNNLLTANSSGLVISKGTIQGPSIILGGSNNVNGSITVKNSSSQDIFTASNAGMIYYCRSSTASFYIKDGSGNNLMTANSSGLVISKGTIQGPTIIAGGNGNTNGAIYVRNSNNTNIITLDNGGISTTSLTASEYIYCNGNTSSYFKIPFYGDNGYMELSASSGMYFSCYDQSVYFGTDGIFYISSANGTTGLYGGVVDTGTVFFSSECSGSYGATIGATYGLFEELDVSGEKPRLVKTDDYGERRLYAFETPTPMFMDVGTGTIDEYGKIRIYIEDIFSETVETEVEYQVILQKYSNGDCFVSERNPSYFVVSGTPGLSFCWEIQAKQKGYDQIRLGHSAKDEKIPVNKMLRNDLDEKAAKFIEDYYKEIEPV